MVSGYHVLKNNARRILKRAPKMKFFYGSYYKHCPVVENRILFESFHGTTISDSPFYILKELLSRERPNFNVFLDPKCDWALGHLEDFPVEINRADLNTLLRVPGIGPKSARRILRARRSGKVDFADLRSMGVVLKRAVYFITCGGKMMTSGLQMQEDFITRQLLAGDENVRQGYQQDQVSYRQLTLFDDFSVGSQDAGLVQNRGDRL